MWPQFRATVLGSSTDSNAEFPIASAAFSGGSTTYTGTGVIYGGGTYTGYTFTVSGFGDDNDGTFTVTASTAGPPGTMTTDNGRGIMESCPGTCYITAGHAPTTTINHTTHLGPFVDIQGCGTACSVTVKSSTQSDYWIFCEMGDASTHSGSSHFNSCAQADYANGNHFFLIGDDDGNAQEPTALFVATSNAADNRVDCSFYQYVNYPCQNDPNIYSGSNGYQDYENRIFYSKSVYSSQLGSPTYSMGTSGTGTATPPTFPINHIYLDTAGQIQFGNSSGGTTAYLTSHAPGTISVDQTSAGSHDGTLLVGTVGTLGNPTSSIYMSNVLYSAGVPYVSLPSGGPAGEFVFCTDCKVTSTSCSAANYGACLCTSSGSGSFARYQNYPGSPGNHWYCQ